MQPPTTDMLRASTCFKHALSLEVGRQKFLLENLKVIILPTQKGARCDESCT